VTSIQKTTITASTGLALAATGVVFGDIGTSPLYALKQTLAVSGSGREAVFGVISLIFWALMLVVTVKYLRFVMRANNHGEGGILALLALLPEKVRLATGGRRMALLLLILIGTALLFGDGALTPAISVLSATEGLAIVNPSLEHWAVPLTVVILAALFAVQSRGTHQIGRVFGPIMVLWFVVIAALGVWHIIGDPSVLAALSPTYGIAYLVAHPGLGFAIGAVVILAVTGAEALYADMGHFGIRPIRLAWAFLVAPSLVLCYLGQAAVVIKDPSAAADPFFSLAPNPTFALFMVILSTAATVIASQALITGVFSLSRQAVQLGLLPRISIRHTSSAHEGQIYVPIANWLLGITSIALVVAFGSSSSLASAYVLAIAGTMTVTTIAFHRVTRDVWGWSPLRSGLLTTAFLILDMAFLLSTITKIFDGGWVPVVLAGLALALMLVWRSGQQILASHVAQTSISWEAVAESLSSGRIARTPGEGIVLASHPDQVPQALAASIRLVRAVPEQLIILTIRTLPVPTVEEGARLTVTTPSNGIRQVVADVGFTETPSVPELLAGLPKSAPLDRTYYLSDRAFHATPAGQMGRIRESLFAFLHRNAAKPAQFFGIPDGQVVTLSTHMDL
jgi:KUP system potassium uptake protein